MRIGFCILSLTFSVLAFAKGEIIVRAISRIQHGSPVVLGDIADMSGVDPKIQRQLERVPLATAPEVGEKLEFSNTAVGGMLRAALEDKELPRLKIPSRVVIERSTHEWNQGAIERELLDFWQAQCADCQLEIDRLSMPAGTFDNWKLNMKRELPRGGFSVAVDVLKGGQAATLWVQGELIVRKRVPVAKRALYFGERVQAADLEWALRDVTLAQDGIPQAEEIAGRRVKTSLRAGDVIFAGALDHEKALHRGDIARVSSTQGGWQVSVNAVVQQDAEIGDTVTLKNPKTNRDLTGVVTSKDEVEIR